MSHDPSFTIIKGKKPLGAAFSHARKVAAKTGGGKKKEREVANRYLKRNGEKAIGKSTTQEDHMNKSTNPAAALLGEHLSKATKAPGRKGEGSRGGKIIGHTRTGKPIYQKGGHHEHFTPGDHADAALAHATHEGKSKAETVNDGHAKARDEHFDKLSAHVSGPDEAHNIIDNEANYSPAPIPATRKKLDKTIGRTESGKDIKASGKGWGTYTADDHADAANAHHEHSYTTGANEDHHQDVAVDHLGKLADKKFGGDHGKAMDYAMGRHTANTPYKTTAAPREMKDTSGSFGGAHSNDNLPEHKPLANDMIGRTKSGKKILADGKAQGGYSSADHADAAAAHSEMAKDHIDHGMDYADEGNHAKADFHQSAADYHLDKRDEHQRASKMAAGNEAKANAGVIGQTSSGQTVHKEEGPKSPAYSRMSRDDHREASDIHANLANDASARGKINLADHHHFLANMHLDHAEKMSNSSGQSPAYHRQAAKQHNKIAEGHAALADHAERHGDSDAAAEHASNAEHHKYKAHKHLSMAAMKSDSSNDFSAADVIGAYLAKAGEGSRGGKVMGHTKSGKPIYTKGSLGAPQHRNWSSADHKDARETHSAQSQNLRFEAVSQKLGGKKTVAKKTHADADHHAKMATMHAGEQGRLSRFGKSVGDNDGGHEFADINNSNPNRILVRPVMDVENSPLNDAIAAAWPGMPFVAQAASNFCSMDTVGKLGI